MKEQPLSTDCVLRDGTDTYKYKVTVVICIQIIAANNNNNSPERGGGRGRDCATITTGISTVLYWLLTWPSCFFQTYYIYFHYSPSRTHFRLSFIPIIIITTTALLTLCSNLDSWNKWEQFLTMTTAKTRTRADDCESKSSLRSPNGIAAVRAAGSSRELTLRNSWSSQIKPARLVNKLHSKCFPVISSTDNIFLKGERKIVGNI